jgi:hypothetical protein
MKVEIIAPYDSEVIENVLMIREFESGIVLVTEDGEINVSQEYLMAFEIQVEL